MGDKASPDELFDKDTNETKKHEERNILSEHHLLERNSDKNGTTLEEYQTNLELSLPAKIKTSLAQLPTTLLPKTLNAHNDLDLILGETESTKSGLDLNILEDTCDIIPSNEENLNGPDVLQNIKIKILYKKEKYDIEIPISATVKDLKERISKATGLHNTLQKIMFKGLVKDGQTLKEIGAIDGSKFMVIGSTIDDILSVRPPDKSSATKVESNESADNKKEHSFCKQRIHMKVLEKGKPEDAMLGIKNVKEPLPFEPLTGMFERGGGKLRLTFKLELDQLWIGTKDRTQKIPLSSIVTIVNEPIEGHEEYHIMGFQFGPTEASRYWIYWVPAQYIDSIKKAIFG